MTKSRIFLAVLAAIALGGLWLRLSAIAGLDAALASPTGYDDGVYFSASALLLRGVLPYRDFVFVHPPGVLYLLAATSWLPDPATGFAAARMLAAGVGAINILLLGLLIARVSNPAGGIVAAVLYAGYPDAVTAERSAYLEGFLNLACLAAANLWLRRREPDGAPRAFVAGIAAGLACAVKFWAGIWVVAAVATAGLRNLRRDVLPFLGGAMLAGLIAVGPLALTAPRNFVTQTLLFQVSRPPDGVLEKAQRLRDIADSGHRAASLFAIVGLLALVVRIVRRRATTAETYFAIVMLLTVAAFLASSSYWNHYNSNLAASQCAVAGLGAAALLRWRYRAAVAVLIFIGIVAIDVRAWREVSRGAEWKSGELLAVRHTMPAIVPREASFFAFDPTWSLVAGRLPDCCDGAPPVVDSYGAMLLTAVQQKGRLESTTAAYRSGAAQPEIRRRLEASRFVLLGWRGHWQLDDPDRAWFVSRFRCVNPEAEDLCTWEQRSRPGPANASVESQILQFAEGWYGREGLPPETWRWMSAHAVLHLPAIEAPRARLELEFEVPRNVLPVAPNIAIHLGGQELDRFTAAETKIARAYEVDVQGDAPQPLTITSDRTFVPAQVEPGSHDTRALSVKLTRIAWRPSGGAATSSRR